jgi:UDP-glucose 4-epimerase
MSRNVVAVLGGAGYIGSHACRELARCGYEPVIIDNFSRGHRVLCGDFRVEEIDILDTDALSGVLKVYKPVAVMHFAAFIEVAESAAFPELYYRNNYEGTVSVINAMRNAGIENLVFSSTAAVYGNASTETTLCEKSALVPLNPYGDSKLKAERAIAAEAAIRSVCLRYFNASGASIEGGIGEAHFPETHLIPLIIQAALGMRDGISVFGSDYPTPDGTCIRDYIHVVDLARAHVRALEYLLEGGSNAICNLGTGYGASVRELIEKVMEISRREFAVSDAPRRAGDPAFLVADPSRANALLGWKAEFGLNEIIESAYQWHESDSYRKLYMAHQ